MPGAKNRGCISQAPLPVWSCLALGSWYKIKGKDSASGLDIAFAPIMGATAVADGWWRLSFPACSPDLATRGQRDLTPLVQAQGCQSWVDWAGLTTKTAEPMFLFYFLSPSKLAQCHPFANSIPA